MRIKANQRLQARDFHSQKEVDDIAKQVIGAFGKPKSYEANADFAQMSFEYGEFFLTPKMIKVISDLTNKNYFVTLRPDGYNSLGIDITPY